MLDKPKKSVVSEQLSGGELRRTSFKLDKGRGITNHIGVKTVRILSTSSLRVRKRSYFFLAVPAETKRSVSGELG